MSDALILVALVGIIMLAVITGLRRGLLVVAGSFLSLLIGLTIAGVGYSWLGNLLVDQFGVVRSLANVISYIFLLVMVQFVCLMALRRLVRLLPHQAVLSRPNQIGGAIGAAAEAVIFTALSLSIFATLPIEASVKEKLTAGPVAKGLINLGHNLQSMVGQAPGRDLTETLNMLTVDPESERQIELGFKTTDVRVNEVAEQRMLELVNKERRANGLKELTLNVKAREVAREHSRDMFAQGYFSHRGLDGRSPFDRMKDGGVKYQTAGENLALAPTIDLAHNGLMNSPGHRANILSENYGTVGIGVIEHPRYGLMVSQEFTD